MTTNAFSVPRLSARRDNVGIGRTPQEARGSSRTPLAGPRFSPRDAGAERGARGEVHSVVIVVVIVIAAAGADLTADLATPGDRRVHVDIRGACADRRDQLLEPSRRQLLRRAWRDD